MAETGGVAIATVHSLLVLVDIVGNSLVCLIIKKNRDMRTPINYLLVNLAVADILYATFMTPDVFIKLTSTHPDGMTGTVLCKMLTGGKIAWIGATSAIVTLAAIAIERYYAVMYPHSNKGNFTKRKVKVIILCSWIFSIILNIPTFLFKNVKSNVCKNMWPKEWMQKTSNGIWFVFVFLIFTLMVGLYSRVVYALWFKRNDDNQLTHQQKGVIKVRKRVTLMIVTVTAIFGICWLTDSVAHVVEITTSYSIDKVVFTVIHTMIMFNSAINPFVYALLNQNFREKIKGMICCTCSTTAARDPARRKPAQGIACTSITTQPTNITEPGSIE